MESIGSIRKMDTLGRIVLPKGAREALQLGEGDSLELFQEGENIVMRKYRPGCRVCGQVTENMLDIFGKQVCVDCARRVAQLARGGL